MNKYPECEKLHEARLRGSQEIGEFIDWLGEEGYEICKYYSYKELHDEGDWENQNGFYPERKSIEQWIAMYFEIDLNKVDEERMQIIKELQDGQ